MRKLEDVINEAVSIDGIPETLKNRLLYILKEDLAYCPPESVGTMWQLCQSSINGYMPGNPKELVQWQKKFLKVWTGRDF